MTIFPLNVGINFKEGGGERHTYTQEEDKNLLLVDASQDVISIEVVEFNR